MMAHNAPWLFFIVFVAGCGQPLDSFDLGSDASGNDGGFADGGEDVDANVPSIQECPNPTTRTPTVAQPTGDGPGYTLSAELMNDLPAMYEAISQENSCFNQPTQWPIVCEFFRYRPCKGTDDYAPRVDCVPTACLEETARFSPQSDLEGEWCLIGPLFEPAPWQNYDPQQWCADTHWFESASYLGNCTDAREQAQHLRARGEAAFNPCSPIPDADVLEACANYFCP